MQKKIIILLCATFAFSTGIYAASATQSDSNETHLVNLPDFSPIYDSVGKAVVNVNVTQVVQQVNQISGDPMWDFFFRQMVPPSQQRQYKTRGLGSGFIISNDGYILTNAHVVDHASSVSVKLSDKREFKAKIVGVDPATDVAVLKIDAKNLPIVKIGDPNQLKPGKWVLAIGSPFGFQNTITQGIVSAMSRDLAEENYIPYIQTDVPINPGNSGGPLINLNGEVVGINSQIYSRSGGYMGISFSIPIDYAMRVASQIKSTGKVKRGRLGIAIQPVTDDLAKSFGLATTQGALVSSVEAGSAAAKAGVLAGDVILKVNDQEITDSNQVPRIVGLLGPNKPIKLEILRNGKNLTLTALTTEDTIAKADDTQITAPGGKAKQIDKLGVIVSGLDKSQLPRGINYGIVVQQINDNARLAGINPGDLIIGVGNKPINNFNEFLAIINHARPGSVLALKVARTNGQVFWTVFIPVPVVDVAPDGQK